VLYAQNPIEIPNGGLHRVKPWFSGRVDFAPDITFAGDDEYPMLGGAVGYFVDRKAASFVFKRRLHTISLFVFRADGLAWPAGETRNVGSARV
jgi:anti-sigma factor RsiW